MTTALTAWRTELPIPGLPDAALKNAVRASARIFCKETLLWIYDLARISVLANTQSYTLTVPADQFGRLIMVDSVKYKINGAADDQFRRLDPITSAPENALSGNWKFKTSTQPSCYDVEEAAPTTLILVPIPTLASASGLLVSVCLRPTETAEVLPDFLYNQYIDEIALGALSYLYGIKGMPWYDPNEALRNGRAFRTACNSAKYKRFTGATNRPMQVRMRRFV